MRPNFVSALLLTALTWESASATQGSGDFALRWQWAAAGGAWVKPVVPAYDLDGDGTANLLTPGCFGRCWIAWVVGGEGLRQLTSSPTAVDYLEWFSFPGASGSVQAVVAFNDNPSELVLGTIEGGRATARTLAFEPGSAKDAVVADIDGDLDLELLVIDPFDLFIHDFDSGALQATKFGFGGADLAVGNIDLDPQLEIAVATELGSCWALDGSSLTVDWGSPNGCGPRLELVAILPGAPLEILTFLGKVDPFPFRLYDPPSTSPVWAKAASGNWYELPSFVGGEIASHPGTEILVAWPQGPVELLDGATGASIDVLDQHALDTVGFGDIDGDGNLELLLSKNSFHAESPVLLVDPVSGETEGRVPVFDLTQSQVAAGDIDGDGDRELVAGGSVVDAEEQRRPAALLFSGAEGSGPSAIVLDEVVLYGESAFDVALGDVDGDERLEIFLANEANGGNVGCFDARTGIERWHLGTGDVPSPLLFTDIGGDESPELILGRRITQDSIAVTALRADLGWFHWQSPDITESAGPWIRLLCHGEFEGLATERVFATGDWGVSAQWLEASSGSDLGALDFEDGVTELACSDLDGDGQLELLASTSSGSLAIADPVSGNLGQPLVQLGEEADAIASADFLGSGSQQIAVVVSDAIHIVEPSTGIVLASADYFENVLYGQNNRWTLDVDDDGRSELVLRTYEKLLVFGLPSTSPNLLIDSFESGNLAYWSAGFP